MTEPVTPRLHCAWLVYRGDGMEAKVGLHRCHGDVKTDDELQGDTIDYLGSTFTFHHSRRLKGLCGDCKKEARSS